jgi:hypothetical protein
VLSGLLLDAFAPPLEFGSKRAEPAVRAVEAAWSLHLVFEVTEDGTRIPRDRERTAYLASDPRGALPFLATPDDEPHATLTGVVEPGLLAPGGVDELHVHGVLPALEAAQAAEGLKRFSTALGASWAMLTPPAAHAIIVEQVVAPESEDVPPLGLPRLDLGEHLPRHVPRRLGWLNYWSNAAAAALGFAGDDTAFASVRRIPGGWLVQLTREALDLACTDHVEALRAAYARLPALGRGR